MENVKKWWAKVVHGIGKEVYWNNFVDSRFTGKYIVTSKIDKNGYVGIYNKKVGDRVVPYYYLEEYKPKTDK